MKKRFLAFWVCMAVLLASFTGCYFAQKDGPSVPSSSQTVQAGSGSGAEEPVEIRTYALPEENVRADSIYVPSPSTGGFWTWAVFTSKTIQAYDPVTRTTYYPCYQAGCKHNDASCSAYFGEISSLAEYRGNFYAMIYYNDDTASAFVTRPVSGGPLHLFAGTFLLMFYAATGRKLMTLGGLGVLAVGAVGSYKLFSHVRTRVQVWRDPWSVYQDQGYQIVQGLIALASGGLFGVGLGQGMPEVIPAAQTDYIFAVIGEEFGIIIGIMIVVFYLVLIVRGILIGINARSTFDALLVFGATVMLALQSFIIIGGVIKLIPLTGITLPFVSYGGSSMVVSLMQMGIIQGVAIKNGQADEAEIEMMGGQIL